MKKTIAMAAVAAVISAFAADTTADGKAAPKPSREERERIRLEKTGGMITRVGEGRAVIVNCQTKFDESVVEAAIEPFRELLKVEMEVRSGKWKMGDPVPADANVAVFVVDDGTLPMSLVAPEARWGVVNAAGIDREGSLRKEVTRVAIMTLGGGVSQYKVSPMQPVAGLADLERIVGCTLTVDVTMSMRANLEHLGMTQTKYTTYKRACEEGWAPAPTNEYQKAVWDRVHAIPQTPMKIEFDPKKGR